MPNVTGEVLKGTKHQEERITPNIADQQLTAN